MPAADTEAEDFVVLDTDGVILPGDQFLLTTDGINDLIPNDAMAQCLAADIENSSVLDTLLSQT